MKRKLFLLPLFLVFVITSIQAQEMEQQASTDDQLIRETIQLYFDGWMTGDTTKIGRAMETTCHLKYVKEDQLVDISRAKYLSFFKPRAKMENTEGRIISLDITRTAASAKCEIQKPGKLYTDYFNLLKINGQWYITDKVSTSIITD